jgi:hypothetical protein
MKVMYKDTEKIVESDKYTYDINTRTFTSSLSNIIIETDMDNINFILENCEHNSITAGNFCTFKTGDNNTFTTGYYCKFDTGENCYFNVGFNSEFVNKIYTGENSANYVEIINYYSFETSMPYPFILKYKGEYGELADKSIDYMAQKNKEVLNIKEIIANSYKPQRTILLQLFDKQCEMDIMINHFCYKYKISL